MAPGYSFGGVIVETWQGSGTATGDYCYRTADGRTGTHRLGYSLPRGVMTEQEMREQIKREARIR